jgi:hypothetical protein
LGIGHLLTDGVAIQGRQYARLSLQLSELAPPAPSPASECCPPFGFGGGGSTFARGRGGRVEPIWTKGLRLWYSRYIIIPFLGCRDSGHPIPILPPPPPLKCINKPVSVKYFTTVLCGEEGKLCIVPGNRFDFSPHFLVLWDCRH